MVEKEEGVRERGVERRGRERVVERRGRERKDCEL